MYDNHIYSEEYNNLKDIIVNILNGDDTKTDVGKLSDEIQELYEDGNMSSLQYDDLMSYIQDLNF